MINQAHFSYPFLVALLIGISFGYLWTAPEALMLLLSAFLPDVDFLREMYLTRKYPGKIFNHHNFITHTPAFYILFLLGLGLWSTKYALLASYGLTTHFIMDTIVAPRGIRWFYPFKNKYYLLADFTKNIEDTNKWLRAYKKLPIYKYDNIAFVLTVVLVMVLYIL